MAQILHIAGQQIAPLPGFGVLRRRQQRVDGDDHLVGVNDLPVVCAQNIDIAPRDKAGSEEKARTSAIPSVASFSIFDPADGRLGDFITKSLCDDRARAPSGRVTDAAIS